MEFLKVQGQRARILGNEKKKKLNWICEIRRRGMMLYVECLCILPWIRRAKFGSKTYRCGFLKYNDAPIFSGNSTGLTDD